MSNKKINLSLDLNTFYKIGFFVLLAVGIFYFFNGNNNSINDIITDNPISSSGKEEKLRKTVEKAFQYQANNDLEGTYSLLTPSDRKAMSFAEYQKKQGGLTNYSFNGTIHSIRVDGDRGIVDVTTDICGSKLCQGWDHLKSRFKVEWADINGNWYIPYRGSSILCEREQPYLIQPEFERALSLIIQRYKNSKFDEDVSDSYKFQSLKNCLDIQYISSDSQLEGAEGVFAFDKNSPKDRLQILVSPRYQAKDDILTAILLIHEITHAYFHAIEADQTLGCFNNEARAFANELAFINSLNKEEQDSLQKRIYSTSDNTALYQTVMKIRSYKGEFLDDKTLQYVKNEPYYQKQCASN